MRPSASPMIRNVHSLEAMATASSLAVAVGDPQSTTRPGPSSDPTTSPSTLTRAHAARCTTARTSGASADLVVGCRCAGQLDARRQVRRRLRGAADLADRHETGPVVEGQVLGLVAGGPLRILAETSTSGSAKTAVWRSSASLGRRT